MANEGRRCTCKCIKNMNIIIGKTEETLFAINTNYPCNIRKNDREANYYKVYGDEFALSCSEEEFKEHFRIIFNK